MKLARRFADLTAKLNLDDNQVASAVNVLDESDQQMEYSKWNSIEIDLLMNVSKEKGEEIVEFYSIERVHQVHSFRFLSISVLVYRVQHLKLFL